MSFIQSPATKVAGQNSLSYALPSGTRDDLNIRHTDRKPAGCSTCSPAGICRVVLCSGDESGRNRMGPAHARERLPRRSRTCQTIQRWCCSFVRHSPLQFTSNRQSPGYFPQVLHGGRQRRSRLRTHNSIRGAPVSFPAFRLCWSWRPISRKHPLPEWECDVPGEIRTAAADVVSFAFAMSFVRDDEVWRNVLLYPLSYGSTNWRTRQDSNPRPGG